MKNTFLILTDVGGNESEDEFVGANAFQVTRCDPINNGKNSKLSLKTGATLLVDESPAEILNMYLDWTSSLTQDEIDLLEDK